MPSSAQLVAVALVSGVLTLSGVWLNNWFSERRSKRELEHKTAESQKERTSAMRREVYMKTTEELAKAFAHLAHLADSEISNSEKTSSQSFLGEAAKFQLVAEPESALMMMTFVSSYGIAEMRLTVKSLALRNAESDIALAKTYYEKNIVEVDRLLSERFKFNEEGRTDSVIFEALGRSLDYFRSQAEKYSLGREKAEQLRSQLHRDFLTDVMSEIKPLGKQIMEIQISIRREIGLTSDIEIFRNHMELQQGKLELAINEVMDAIKI